MFDQSTDSTRRVLPLACAHRRRSVEATIAHLAARGLWSEWQRRGLVAGRCPRCRQDVA